MLKTPMLLATLHGCLNKNPETHYNIINNEMKEKFFKIKVGICPKDLNEIQT
jgi:hypothetical protein